MAVPLLPATVAVMVTGPPAETPVINPAGETVAIDALLVVQVATCPLMTTLFWSRTIAVSGVVPPFATAVTEGETDTVVGTGAITVTDAVPFWPSLVAVIVTGPPAATPVTTPPDTVAMPVFDDDQLTVRPVNVAPDASRNVAANVVVDPGVTEADVGAMVIVATGGGMTVTVADPSCPSLDATIATGPPIVTAVTSPADETVAILVLVELHETVRFARVPPCASRGVAVSWTVCPTDIECDDGETRTDATGGGGSVPPPQATRSVRHVVSATRASGLAVHCNGTGLDTLFRARSRPGVGVVR
jgi:hypothetical protein